MDEKSIASEAYYPKEDRKRFLEVEKAARLLIEKIENSKGEG